MLDFRVSALSVVNQIKSNLRDRYRAGYPILKELLQNADDAKARRFSVDALPGWPGASNPILRGPGLLIVNDGIFREKDERDIVSFGESGKATDSAAIGKVRNRPEVRVSSLRRLRGVRPWPGPTF
ncbi:MAG: hypothetical protein OXC11_04225 [Rhodospirillales bacterium]|nr:hypothetical protein [Rhodospirillales bacterium]